MSRYVHRNDDGTPLYKGEMIDGRRYVSASRIGYGPALLVFAGISLGLLAAGWPWWLAVLLAGLAGQVSREHLMRRYSRWIRALPVHDAPPSPEQAARDERIELMRISAEAELPWIDYQTGEVWPAGRTREWLAEQDRQAETRRQLAERVAFEKVIKANRAEIARLVAEGAADDDTGAELAALAQLDAAEATLDDMEQHLDRLERQAGSRQLRALLADRQQIESWAAAPWADYPDNHPVRMPSGARVPGAEINRLVRQSMRKRLGLPLEETP